MPGASESGPFDATSVKEPGQTGSLWRIHSSVRLPSLACDFFKLTATRGAGTGESFRQFPISAGDYLRADRGYSTAAGLRHVACASAFATVRVNTGSLPLGTLSGGPFDLLASVQGLRRAATVGCWPVAALDQRGIAAVGRVCGLRKTTEAIRLAQRALRRQASKRRKRFQSLAQLGHLPKHTDESAQAWLYGKLLVALLVEKLPAHARSISPRGCHVEAAATA